MAKGKFQVSGKPVDRRADVWALGVVLYEMLTGTRPFASDDVSKTLARVIDREPDWKTLPTSLPPVFAAFLRGCLKKDPKDRVRDVGDVRLALSGAFETTTPSNAESALAPLRVWQRPLPMAAGAALLVVATALLVRGTTPVDAGSQVARFGIIPADGAALTDYESGIDVIISPDGTRIAYLAIPDGSAERMLYVRNIEATEQRLIAGTESARDPFFSPDGEWIGFGTARSSQLMKVPFSGGPVLTIADHWSTSLHRGAHWTADDNVIYGSLDALYRMSAGGDTIPEPLTEVEPNEFHAAPRVLPGGRAAVFAAVATDGPRIDVLSLDTNERRTLVEAASSPYYVPSGYLAFQRGSTLMAVAFDVEALEVRGTAVVLLEGIRTPVGYAVADNGTLVYLRRPDDAPSSLVWVDRDGQESRINLPPRDYAYPRLSPDGGRLALTLEDQEWDIWVWDFSTETLRRLTEGPGVDAFGNWTSDGNGVVFSSSRAGVPSIFWKAADGTGTAERLTEGTTALLVNAITPDGTQVVATAATARPNGDLVSVLLDDARSIHPLFGTEFDERHAALSPDGRWMAYQSDASGVYEIYVRPFPDAEAGLQLVSTSGGTDPVWSPSGDEVFYRQLDRMVAVAVETEPAFTIEARQTLFEGTYRHGSARDYDVSADGQRFLMVTSAGQTPDDGPPPQIEVVLNWHSELLERVPIN